MRLCEQVDEWYVLRTTQNGEFVCLFLVPRLTPVERPSSLLWRADLHSVVSSFYPCVVTSLRDAPDECAHSALRLKAHENLALAMSSQFISLHMVAEQLFRSVLPDGRVVVDLAVRWRYLETRRWMGDLESTMETRLNSSLSSSRFWSRGTNHRSRHSHVKRVQDENRYH